MDIKEIALKHSREYLTFKLGGRKGLDVAEIVCDDEIYAEIVDELAQQFESIIESYKAELLKEVGEPVAYSIFICVDPCDVYLNKDDAESEYTRRNERYPDKTRSLQYLFTSDQVSAAIIKATNPLEEEIAAAQEEILIERLNGDHWSDAYSKWVNTDESARRLIELQDQLATLTRQRDLAVEALEAIAGRRIFIDNLASNVDIAVMTLDAIKESEAK